MAAGAWDVRLRQRRLEGSVLRQRPFPQSRKAAGRSFPLPCAVFRNVNGHFENVPAFHDAAQYRGAAFADFDGDGKGRGGDRAERPARLYRNVSANTGHWVALKLTGAKAIATYRSRTAGHVAGWGRCSGMRPPQRRLCVVERTTGAIRSRKADPHPELRLPGRRKVQVIPNVQADRITEVTEK